MENEVSPVGPRSFDLPNMRGVRYGRACSAGLAEAVGELGMKRVMLVTSPSVASGDVGESITESLRGLLFCEFTGVRPHAPTPTVLSALDIARTFKADGVISVGGGSAIDTAKAVAMAIHESVSDDASLEALSLKPGMRTSPLRAEPLPHISVPTTLGSSEFTHSFTLTNLRTKTKDMYWDQRLVPKLAFLDAEIAIHTPDWLWASTGMKTVDHCIEWYLSRGRTPFTDALVLGALRELCEALPLAVGDERSAEARQRCQIAAWMAAFGALNVVGGLSHAIGHHLGPRTNMVHGHTTSIVLPKVVEFNRPVSSSRQAVLAEAMGANIGGLDENTAAQLLVAKLQELITQLGLPRTLTEAGVGEADLTGIPLASLNDPMLRNNPRNVTHAEIAELIESLR